MSHREHPVPIIAGNWKMNKGPADTRTFFEAFRSAYSPRGDRSVWFFPPAVSLQAAIDSLQDRADLLLGVQNVHWEASGAFTGETSATMAAQAGARATLVGHSERRQLFHENDADVARKTIAALGAGLIPVVCVGETLEQRQAGQLEQVLARQLDAVLDAIPAAEIPRIVLAYEPVWAIGTGVNATPQDAAGAHACLRDRVRRRTNAAIADSLPILYGGSVKPANAAELLAAPDVDGLLVGGASLEPVPFARIAHAFVPTR